MEKEHTGKEGSISISIRFPRSLYDAIKALAKEDKRTYTGMVVRLLYEAMETRGKNRNKGVCPHKTEGEL